MKRLIKGFIFTVTMSVYQIGISAPVITPASLPSTVAPSQISQAIQMQAPKRKVYLKTRENHLEEETKKQFGPEASKIKFHLRSIKLVGNHVYTNEQLLPLYKDKLNTNITIEQIGDIVSSITHYYRNNGYIISRAYIPPQHARHGVIEIDIVEGYISKVNIGGKPRGAAAIVQRYGDNLLKSKPLNIHDMEHYLLIANDLPGVETHAVISPSKTPDAADMDLLTYTRTVNAYLSYDDYGTRYIGPQQITGDIGFDSIFRSGDLTHLNIVKTPKGKELTYSDGSYTFPIGNQGMSFKIGRNQAETQPRFALESADIQGNTINYYTQLLYPLIRSPRRSLVLHSGFSYLDSKTTSFGSTVYVDHLRPFVIGGTYNSTDDSGGTNYANLDITQGLSMFNTTTNTHSLVTSRFGGQGTFTKVDFQVGRSQAIRGPWSLYGYLTGQYSFNPLLVEEQFSYGGSQVGRGYDPAEIIGDRGLGGSLELRYSTFPGMAFLQSFQFYTFYDAGVIWDIKQISNVSSKQSATSAGLGTRLTFNDHFSGNLMYAQPISKPVSSLSLIGNGRSPRVLFSMFATL